MSDGKPLFEKSRGVEDVQQLRLLVLLDETVRGQRNHAGGPGPERGPPDAGGQPGVGQVVPADAGRVGEGAAWRAAVPRPGSSGSATTGWRGGWKSWRDRWTAWAEEMNQGLAAVQGEVKALQDAARPGYAAAGAAGSR